MKIWRIVPVLALALSGVLVSAGPATAAAPPPGGTYTCNGQSNGGVIPPGTYNSMLITGVCYMTYGNILIRGNLTIAPGALLDGAATLGDPPSTTNPPPADYSGILPATVLIGGNVSVGSGAVFALGCSPAGGCMGVTYDHIGGNVTAIDSQGVLIQAVAIGGSVSVLGGGGGVLGGPPLSGGCFAANIPAPWSDDNALSNPNTGTPQYTDLEDSTIGGNLSVSGVQSCFVASFRDQVSGNVNFSGDTTSDPDGMELGSNIIGGNMTCLANLPAVQFGDSSAASNVVGGSASGQCGFNVMPVDPAANPDNGFNSPPFYPAGPPTHISVPGSSLGNSSGAHIQDTTMGTVPYATMASGDTLTLSMNTVDLTGTGITGTSLPETVGATVHPDGSDSFFAKDQCSPCSFGGQSGSVEIVAYGSTSASGVTTGRFVVASGGANGGALGGLAGYGTFSSAGQPPGTLRLVERLVLG